MATVPGAVSQLARFAGHDASRLAAFAARGPRLAQLAVSFPLLFSILANDTGTASDREVAVGRAIAGARLRDVAEALGVPYVLRHLPPEACPASLRAHRWSAGAEAQLRKFMPADPLVARQWVETIFFAAALGTEEIGLWVAKRRRLTQPIRQIPSSHLVSQLFPLVLYAWVSSHRRDLLGLFPPWRPELGTREAVERCKSWVLRGMSIAHSGVPDPWIGPTPCGPYDVIPLTTLSAIADEAAAMENCLLDYAEPVALDECRVFSVRFNGHCVATMLVEAGLDDRLELVEIEGPRHAACDEDLVQQLRQMVEASPAPLLEPEPDDEVPGHAHVQTLLAHFLEARPEAERGALSRLTWDELAEQAAMLEWMVGWHDCGVKRRRRITDRRMMFEMPTKRTRLPPRFHLDSK